MTSCAVCTERSGTDTESEANGGRPSESFLRRSANLLAGVGGVSGAGASGSSSANVSRGPLPGPLSHTDWRQASVSVPPLSTRSTFSLGNVSGTGAGVSTGGPTNSALPADEASDEKGAVLHVPSSGAFCSAHVL